MFIINEPTRVKTKLQQDLKTIIMMDKNKIMTNLNIIVKKKETLEETLFILSSILKANCEGIFAKISCNTGAKLTGLSDIYNLLIESESLPSNLTHSDSDIKKLEIIKNAYDYGDSNLISIIKKFASKIFERKVYIFIKQVIPVVEKLITSKFKGPNGDEPVYGELQQFRKTYFDIKEAYDKLSIKGGRKQNKKKKTKKRTDKKKTTKKKTKESADKKCKK